MLDPLLNSNPQKYKYEVAFWNEEGIRTPWQEKTTGAEQALTMAQVPDLLVQIFRANRSLLGNVIIEFVLPDDLLSYPVDQLDDKTRRKGKIGARYPLVIRSLSRMQDPIAYELCLRKWKILRTLLAFNPDEHIRWLHESEPWSEKLVDEIIGSDKIVCMGLTFMPDPEDESYDTLDLMIDTGLPAALWPRIRKTEVASHPSLRQKLQKIVTQESNLRNLAESIRKAYTDIDDDSRKNLTFIWDDPTRIAPSCDDVLLEAPEMI